VFIFKSVSCDLLVMISGLLDVVLKFNYQIKSNSTWVHRRS